MAWARFQGAGQQWSTHGGYYKSAATDLNTRQWLPPAMPASFLGSPQGMGDKPVTGGTLSLLTAGRRGWDEMQRMQKKMAKKAGKVPGSQVSAAAEESPVAGPAGRTVTGPVEGAAGYFASTGRPPPPERAGTGNTPPPLPESMGFRPPGIRAQTAPASVIPSVIKSRMEAFKFPSVPSVGSRHLPDPF